MMGEGEAHADRGGELGAVAARAEEPDRRQRDIGRHRVHVAERMAFRKSAALEQQQFLEAFEEVVALARILPGAQRIGRDRIGARRAAEAEIDAAGKQRLQHLETLGDHQRRVVRQHHAARADAQMRRRRRDLADHDLRRGAGDVRKIMVFGDPVTLVAKPVGKPRQIERIAQRRRARRSRGHGRQIEDGKRDHAAYEPAPAAAVNPGAGSTGVFAAVLRPVLFDTSRDRRPGAVREFRRRCGCDAPWRGDGAANGALARRSSCGLRRRVRSCVCRQA